MPKVILIICIHTFCSLLTTKGQQKFTIFFAFGSADIETAQMNKLRAIERRHDFSELDSVSFIGYADSIGDLESNLKLSLKRARTVADFYKERLPKSVSVTINARGEKNKKQEDLDRRVEITLFFKAKTSTPLKDTVPDCLLPKENCHKIAYEVINEGHVELVERGKKKFILLERIGGPPDPKIPLYYGLPSKDSTVQLFKLKWTTKKTGIKLWEKPRAQCLIPFDAYDKYRVFYSTSPPCDTACNEQITFNNPLRRKTTCLVEDYFLMNNLQYKLSPFNRKKAKIRVPIDYVDQKATYYLGNSFSTKIKWETHKGKRNRNYLFTTLPVIRSSRTFYYFPSIHTVKECCTYSRPWPSNCICINNSKKCMDIQLGFEVGDHYSNKSHKPYAGIILYKEWPDARLQVLAGMDSAIHLYTSLKYRYYIGNFPLRFLTHGSLWVQAAPSFNTNQVRFYLGSELRNIQRKEGYNTGAINAHLGLTFDCYYNVLCYQQMLIMI